MRASRPKAVRRRGVRSAWERAGRERRPGGAASCTAKSGGPSRAVLPVHVLTGTHVRRYASACSPESCGQQTGSGFRKGAATGKGDRQYRRQTNAKPPGVARSKPVNSARANDFRARKSFWTFSLTGKVRGCRTRLRLSDFFSRTFFPEAGSVRHPAPPSIELATKRSSTRTRQRCGV